MNSPPGLADPIQAIGERDSSAGNLIDGRWSGAAGARTFERRNPADPFAPPGRFPDSGRADIDRAVRAAQAAFSNWASRPASERARTLTAAASLAEERAEQWAVDLTRETGKPVREARAEAARVGATLTYFAADAWLPRGEQFESSAGVGRLYTLRRALGVVGLITPWNFPLAIPAWKLAPALMAGNTVILKPAEDAPRSAMNLAAVLADAGCPAGVVNVVIGRGPAIGAALVAHEHVVAISFTGSARVGRQVRGDATARGKRVQLELGGQNPLVVMSDADLDRAVEAAYAGAFLSAGQKCTATRRIFVEEPVYEEFRERLLARIERSVVGDPADPRTEIGPLVNERSREGVLGAIERGRREGGRLLTDPQGPAGSGYYLRPALFEDVADEATLSREEVFGPVAALYSFRTLDEALARANAVEYGLSAAIFTAALASAQRFVAEAQAGVIHVNSPTTGADVHVPFGGVKGSAWGPREQGREAMDFYTEGVTVYEER
jgi:alpha-ketoglutaric semialdehyde dehydrogenase